MFRVEFFCDDKKLANAIRALTGLALGQPNIAPMINAEKTKNGLKQETNGKLVGLFAAHLRKRKITQVKAGDVKSWLESQGNSALSYSYLLKQAKSAGVLKQTGTGSASVYTVIAPPPKKKR
jgi:hypothetical protein